MGLVYLYLYSGNRGVAPLLPTFALDGIEWSNSRTGTFSNNIEPRVPFGSNVVEKGLSHLPRTEPRILGPPSHTITISLATLCLLIDYEAN